MFDKYAIGLISLLFVILSGAPYIYSTLIGKTKPHLFTWIIWGLLAGIASAAQYSGNAGPGAWGAGLGAIFSVITALLAFSHGERNVTRSDWITFLIGLGAIPLWYFTSSPLAAVILVTLIDALGYYPTFRKSFTKPGGEMIFSYIISNMKHITSIFAMTEYSFTTLLYPAVLFIMNTGLIGMLAWRRRALGPTLSEK